MTKKEEMVQRIIHERIIAIVRGVYGEDCLRLAQALHKGGINLLEVTFDQSKSESWEETAGTLQLLKREMQEAMEFGAGTVTSAEMVEYAKNAGVQYIISPNVDEKVIRKTKECGLVSIPGAMTASEVLSAYEYGADIVKIFPVAVLGASYIRALRGPINHVPLIAVGGINEKNAGEYLSAGAVGVGVGGNLVNKEWIKNGEFDKITALAECFVDSCRR